MNGEKKVIYGFKVGTGTTSVIVSSIVVVRKWLTLGTTS